MVLTELAAVASADLPVAELSTHLHLGTGFADDGHQNVLLETCLRAALATIEARTGKAIFERQFGWTIYRWSTSERQGLPIAPVSAIESLKTVTSSGEEHVVASTSYGLVKDAHRPCIIPIASCLPTISTGGHVEVVVSAGFGTTWVGLPEDLKQAVLVLAADYYENRSGTASGSDIPQTVVALIEAYRPIRLTGRAA